ncbi:MAG: translocation protein TolB [Pelotomaculum sp. PtaU1.Bin065]|nr:MAG: translocation protein TolB [Pelotomaculum sp. PtaU1.Bin065]
MSGKITPLDAQCNKGKNRVQPDIASGGSSLDELLSHMRRVREAVPVNERLREELRARLAGMRMEGGTDRQRPVTVLFPAGGRSRRPVFFRLIPAVLLLAAVSWIWWSLIAPKSLEAGRFKEISRFWLEESPLDFTCGTPGQGFIAVRGGALQLLDQYGNQTGTVEPPAGQSYGSPVLSRTGDKLALVRRYDTGGEEMIMALMPPGPLGTGAARQVEAALTKAEVLLAAGQGKGFSGLAWSPDGQTLAYVQGESGGRNEVYLLTKGKEPVSLGPGNHPAWSPDGSRLVVERAGENGRPELWLTGPGDSGTVFLTEGERPAWGARGYLAYIRSTTTERVLTYSPDGDPLFTVRQEQGEIRTIDLGRKGDIAFKQPGRHAWSGDRLLLAPESKTGADELNWLRNLASEGVREPRTLLLDKVNNYQKIGFSQAGKTLLVARREGGTVALAQVDLQERLTRGVNGYEEKLSAVQ